MNLGSAPGFSGAQTSTLTQRKCQLQQTPSFSRQNQRFTLAQLVNMCLRYVTVFTVCRHETGYAWHAPHQYVFLCDDPQCMVRLQNPWLREGLTDRKQYDLEFVESRLELFPGSCTECGGKEETIPLEERREGLEDQKFF